jgi:inorganic phosphate transporter, PiT family
MAHVTSGGVMGAGTGKRAAEVNWTTAQRMAFAWLVTIPAAAVIAGAFYLAIDEIGRDIAGAPSRRPGASADSSMR